MRETAVDTTCGRCEVVGGENIWYFWMLGAEGFADRCLEVAHFEGGGDAGMEEKEEETAVGDGVVGEVDVGVYKAGEEGVACAIDDGGGVG